MIFSSPYANDTFRSIPRVTQTTLITPATSEPISLAEVKSWLRIPFPTTEDDELLRIITRARSMAEDYTGRILAPQQWQMITDTPKSVIRLNREPVISVDLIEYIQDYSADTWITYSTSNWMSRGPYLRPRMVGWPITTDWQSFRISFTAGYTNPALYPQGYIQAIKHLITDIWEHRADEDQRAAGIEGMLVKDIPFGAREQLNRYRVWSV